MRVRRAIANALAVAEDLRLAVLKHADDDSGHGAGIDEGLDQLIDGSFAICREKPTSGHEKDKRVLHCFINPDSVERPASAI